MCEASRLSHQRHLNKVWQYELQELIRNLAFKHSGKVNPTIYLGCILARNRGLNCKEINAVVGGDYNQERCAKEIEEVVFAISNDGNDSQQSPSFCDFDRVDKIIYEAYRHKNFNWDDIPNKLDNFAVQQVIKEVDRRDLASAIANAEESVKDKFLTNMSARLRQQTLDDISFIDKQDKTDVEIARQKIIAVIHRLCDGGSICIYHDPA